MGGPHPGPGFTIKLEISSPGNSHRFVRVRCTSCRHAWTHDLDGGLMVTVQHVCDDEQTEQNARSTEAVFPCGGPDTPLAREHFHAE